MGGYPAAGPPHRRPTMSLKPTLIQPVPEETARVARAAFRKGNPLLRLRDELGAIFADGPRVGLAFGRRPRQATVLDPAGVALVPGARGGAA